MQHVTWTVAVITELQTTMTIHGGHLQTVTTPTMMHTGRPLAITASVEWMHGQAKLHTTLTLDTESTFMRMCMRRGEEGKGKGIEMNRSGSEVLYKDGSIFPPKLLVLHKFYALLMLHKFYAHHMCG